jgi:para-nitrobenzyl esterase
MQQWSEQVVAATPCAGSTDALACLQQLPVAALAGATSTVLANSPARAGSSAGPTIDGDVLPASPLTRISAGQHNQVPFIIGSNASETTSQLFGLPLRLTVAEYQQRLQRMFASSAPQVLARYPATTDAEARTALVAVTTDSQFTCPARTVARAASTHQTAPVRRYFFSQSLKGGSPLLSSLGASHGLELYYLFQHVAEIANYTPTTSDVAVENAMRVGWASLAASGDPTAGGNLTWPVYSVANDTTLELGETITPRDGIRTALCDFWDSLNLTP